MTINLSNSIEFIILYFAIIRFGAVVNPIPYGTNNENLKSFLKLSGSKIFFTKKFFNKENIVNIKINNYKHFLKKINNYSEIFHVPKILEEDICALYFSSGTTKKSKLIKYSNLAMTNNQKMMVKSKFLQNHSVHMCILPMGHTAALRYTIKNALITAGKVIIYKSFWEIKDNFWKEIYSNSINFVGVVPTILQTLFINSKNINKKIKNLKFIGCGSSILSKKLQTDFEKKFKTKVSNLYGMSEVGLSTFDDPYKDDRKIGSIGEPLSGVKIKLFNDKRNIINKSNKVGEIGIKTPAIFSGYMKLKKEKKMFIKKYFLSGDLGKYSDNKIFFVDRNKDIIIKGGINVAPQEIDDCLNLHPYINESATLGISDKFFGENIKSFVVLLENKKIKEEEILNYCRKKLGFFKSPIKIQFIKKLPRTQSGKILKRNLK